jgi:hypothetical protein
VAQVSDAISLLWQKYLPRLEQAKIRDSKRATLPFVDLHQDNILAMPVVPLDIQRFLLLQEAGCFEVLEELPVSQALIFLWIVNPKFEPNPKKAKRFYKAHRKLDLQAYAKGIEDYLSSTFNLMPGGKEAGKSDGANGQGWVASMVDTIASEYGWPEDVILTIPLHRIFQYVARITMRLGGSPIAFSSEADRIKGLFMDEANNLETQGA